MRGLFAFYCNAPIKELGEKPRQPKTMKVKSFAGIRSVILDKKARTKAADFMVVLKPGPASSYKNSINILDEMTISAVKRYALVDISAEEDKWMNDLDQPTHKKATYR